jgi:hypothetical protein
MPNTKRGQDEPRRPEPRDAGPQRERSHERTPDDPGRGQGDVLDDKIPQESDDSQR